MNRPFVSPQKFALRSKQRDRRNPLRKRDMSDPRVRRNHQLRSLHDRCQIRTVRSVHQTGQRPRQSFLDLCRQLRILSARARDHHVLSRFQKSTNHIPPPARIPPVAGLRGPGMHQDILLPRWQQLRGVLPRTLIHVVPEGWRVILHCGRRRLSQRNNAEVAFRRRQLCRILISRREQKLSPGSARPCHYRRSPRSDDRVPRVPSKVERNIVAPPHPPNLSEKRSQLARSQRASLRIIQGDNLVHHLHVADKLRKRGPNRHRQSGSRILSSDVRNRGQRENQISQAFRADEKKRLRGTDRVGAKLLRPSERQQKARHCTQQVRQYSVTAVDRGRGRGPTSILVSQCNLPRSSCPTVFPFILVGAPLSIQPQSSLGSVRPTPVNALGCRHVPKRNAVFLSSDLLSAFSSSQISHGRICWRLATQFAACMMRC